MVQQFCTLTQKPLIFGAFCVFRGKKHPLFTIAPLPRPFGLEGATFFILNILNIGSFCDIMLQMSVIGRRKKHESNLDLAPEIFLP
jgi:hypothetical protein